MRLAKLVRVPSSPRGRGAKSPFGIARLLARKFVSIVEVGSINVELPTGDRIEGVGRLPGPDAEIRFTSWRGVRRLLMHGDIGFAAGYLEGDWTSRDIVALIELGARNGSRMLDALGGLMPFRLLNWAAHR